MEVESERAGHFLGEEGAERAAADPAHDLADQVAVGDGVVAVGGSGLPEGLLGGERFGHRVPGPHLFPGQRGVQRRQAGLVGEQEANRQLFLPRLRELGPVGRHGRVEVEAALLGQEVGADRGGALGGREDELERLVVVRPVPLTVEGAAAEVDDLAAAQVHAEGGTDFAALLEIAGEARRGPPRSRAPPTRDGAGGLRGH